MAVSTACLPDTIVKVWGIINRHFESTLVSVGRSDVASKAKIEIKSQVTELRDVVDNCAKRLASIEDYIRELQNQGARDVTDAPSTSTALRVEVLAGDWQFLHLSTGQVFGYLKAIPETVTVTEAPDPDTGSHKSSEFTIPAEVLAETEAVVVEPSAGTAGGHALLCPCCQVLFDGTEFWKHALWEIASKGNRVKAWQVVDRENRTRWIVDSSLGWRNPIYRPRDVRGMCEIGQSLAALNLSHFLTDREFSTDLDNTFQYLAKGLTS